MNFVVFKYLRKLIKRMDINKRKIIKTAKSNRSDLSSFKLFDYYSFSQF